MYTGALTSNATEYQISLAVKIAFIEGILATTVPQIQHKVPQESHVAVLHIQGGT